MKPKMPEGRGGITCYLMFQVSKGFSPKHRLKTSLETANGILCVFCHCQWQKRNKCLDAETSDAFVAPPYELWPSCGPRWTPNVATLERLIPGPTRISMGFGSGRWPGCSRTSFLFPWSLSEMDLLLGLASFCCPWDSTHSLLAWHPPSGFGRDQN